MIDGALRFKFRVCCGARAHRFLANFSNSFAPSTWSIAQTALKTALPFDCEMPDLSRRSSKWTVHRKPVAIFTIWNGMPLCFHTGQGNRVLKVAAETDYSFCMARNCIWRLLAQQTNRAGAISTGPDLNAANCVAAIHSKLVDSERTSIDPK